MWTPIYEIFWGEKDGFLVFTPRGQCGHSLLGPGGQAPGSKRHVHSVVMTACLFARLQKNTVCTPLQEECCPRAPLGQP